MSAVTTYFVLTSTAALLVTSLLLIYPVVAYARNVAYTEAIVFLALAFFMVTVVSVADFVLEIHDLANAARAIGAVFAWLGVWFFAREFVHVEGFDLDYVGGLNRGDD